MFRAGGLTVQAWDECTIFESDGLTIRARRPGKPATTGRVHEAAFTGVHDESGQVGGCAGSGVRRVPAGDVGASGGYFLKDEFPTVRLVAVLHDRQRYLFRTLRTLHVKLRAKGGGLTLWQDQDQRRHRQVQRGQQRARGARSLSDFGWPACESVCAGHISADSWSIAPLWTRKSAKICPRSAEVSPRPPKPDRLLAAGRLDRVAHHQDVCRRIADGRHR
jgi:hypothetical protein